MTSYYNENDKYCAAWLRNLISAGLIAPGDVDDRSILDVRPDDLIGYTQCHFFAGIGGWSLAARLAGFPDRRPLWTGSCPCQPFSVAGKQEGQADERHLWPVFFELIRGCRPPVVMGEQVAAAVGKDWLDGVHSDLEGIGYACGAAVVPACAVDAPHRRERLWFVADAGSERRGGWEDATGRNDASGPPTGWRESPSGSQLHGEGTVADSESRGRPGEHLRTGAGMQARRIEEDGRRYVAESHIGRSFSRFDSSPARHGDTAAASYWSQSEYLSGADGKARRVGPGIRLLAHGVPARVGKLRAYGNAIVPQVAAEVIGAYLDAERLRLTGAA